MARGLSGVLSRRGVAFVAVVAVAVAAGACSATDRDLRSGDADAAADAGADAADADAADTGDVDAAADAPCTPVQHFNGYYVFQDCHEVGHYDEALALTACANYFGVSCQVLTNPNLCNGINIVAHKAEAWIAWTWTESTGTARESWTITPECPTASDQAWW